MTASRPRRTIVLLPLLLAAAGCTGDYVPDYREVYPVRVQLQSTALPLAFAPARAELPSDQAVRLDAFVADYRQHGSGSLAVTANPSGAGDTLARARADAVGRHIRAEGVPAAAIVTQLRESTTRPGEVIVSYEQAKVEVPECGDWSKNTAIDSTNTASVNFGCSTQRYIGLMTADPADLLRPRAAEPHDGQRTVDVIQKYRAGRQTGAQPPAGQSTSGSSFSVGP
jgi:pilus biogenesis lipoprotein CpaD